MLELFAEVLDVELQEVMVIVVGTVVDHSTLIVVADFEQIHPLLLRLQKNLDVLEFAV